MKNVKEIQLKKCIFLTTDEYREILQQIYSTTVKVVVDYDGLSYDTEIDISSLLEKLADYFDVNEITSIHCDDADFVGIWIVYKD